MQIEPSEDAFAVRYARGEAQVVWTTLVADLETPVSAFLKLGGGKAMSFLLESVEGGAVRGRYSMIGLDPDLIWRCHRGQASLCRPALGADFLPEARPAFESLRALLAESAIPDRDGLPPMAAGVFGYLGYDMVRLMERLPEPKATGPGVPDAILTRPTLMVVFDAVRDEITVVTPVRPQAGIPARAAHERAQERLDAMVVALEGPLPAEAGIDIAAIAHPEPASNTSEAEFHAMVANALVWYTPCARLRLQSIFVRFNWQMTTCGQWPK